MTEKDKLKKLKKLADAMYYAAQYLTTDASRLHKAMEEYHQFIIHECKEEPVSEDLEKAAVEAFKQIVDSDKNNFLEIFKAGAKWQKEQMMANAVDAQSWEDIRRIYLIVNSIINDVGMDNLTDKSIYQEVLKRFKKTKKVD